MDSMISSLQFNRFFANSISFPNAANVTPNDSADLANVASALWIGTTGSVKVDLEGSGTGITLAAVPAGTLLRLRVKKVYSNGTTASGIVALW